MKPAFLPKLIGPAAAPTAPDLGSTFPDERNPMNTAERITSAGRPAITRRSLLGGLAAATVTTPAVAVPILPTSAKRTPQEAWAAFVATLDGMIPEGDRLQVFGSATCVRAEIYHTEIEQVHPRVRMPVERIVASYWMNDGVWQSEGVYA